MLVSQAMNKQMRDECAKEATERNLDRNPKGIPHTDLKQSFREAMNASWHQEWFRMNGNKLEEIKPTIQKWKFSGFREMESGSLG